MFSAIRGRLGYANVVATLAMVFAMTGGAYAASKILITNTKQIKPSVLAQLKGKAGPAGAAGAPGPAGPAGPAGPQGPAGAKGENGAPAEKGAQGIQGVPGKDGKNGTTGFTEVLPSGKSERGVLAESAQPAEPTGAFLNKLYMPISFDIPLEAAVTAHVIPPGATDPTGCSGTVSSPQALPGNLCVFVFQEQNVRKSEEPGEAPEYLVVNPEEKVAGTAGLSGAYVAVPAAAPGGMVVNGVWVVTAAS